METRKVSWIKQGGADRKQRSSNNGEETGGSKLRIPEGGGKEQEPENRPWQPPAEVCVNRDLDKEGLQNEEQQY